MDGEGKLFESTCAVPAGNDNRQDSTDSESLANRWTTLRSVFRTFSTSHSPVDLVSKLRTPTPNIYVELRKHLKDTEWARAFVKENGVEALLDTLKSLQGRTLEEVQLKVECGQCLRLVMDSRVGLDYIMENADYTQKLASALDTDDIPVKKQVFELLSALCVYRPDGYTRALETLEHYKNLKKQRYRFLLVVDEMRSSEVVDYSTALVAFVNCVIISPSSLNDRIRIRNEFLGLKILEVLDKFRKQCTDGSNSDLAVQMDVFDEQRSTDEGQFSGPDGVDLSSHMDVFFAILRQVAETPQEIPFLSILQHLLRTDLNQPLSEVVWETAETLVHRATLLEGKQEADRLLRASHLGGLMRCHCSCHYRSNVQITEDCDNTPGKKNRPNQLSFCSPDGTRTPTLLLSPSQYHPPPTPYDTTSSPTFPCLSNDTLRSQCKGSQVKQHPAPCTHISKQTSMENHEIASKANCAIDQSSNSGSTHQRYRTASNSSSKDRETAFIHCDKNVPSDNKSVTTYSNCNNCVSSNHVNCDRIMTNKLSNSESSPVEDVKLHTHNIPPPPPPPPPLPMMGGFPPPPPPPPPASFLNQPVVRKAPVDLTLPQQDTPKPKTKMKSFNWSKIPSSKVIGKDNLWSRVAKNHTGSPNDLDFDVMERLFCQQPVSTNGHISPKFGDPADTSDKRRKEIQEINLLDGKRSLNINIFLKQFRSSHDSIARILEDGTHEDLGAERLRGLLKILPEADEAELLKNFDGDKTKLGNAEKFLLKLIGASSYKLRIESMLLKEEFMSNQEFLENSIETIRCAAQELEDCKKLHEILYMVLVAGNFLNAGGYAGNAAGFKMLSLLKLTDIRANKPSMTLIHYVAEQVFKKRPDLLEFPVETQNLEEASKISMETLKTDVASLFQRVSKISTQVAVAEEQIKSQMHDFVQFSESKVETIQNEINNLDGVRQRLADFLCEDTTTFKLEDCFKVFHNFCSRFKAALQENERRQKQEKLAEARRKQREQQIALKRRSLELSDSRTGVDADPIMDQLLGDIRSGFPERRLGDMYRRSRRSFDPEENSTLNVKGDEKKKAQNALKRHSDPAMLEKCGGSTFPDDKSVTFKSRRCRFLDETNGPDIIGYLQNPGLVDAGIKERRSFGSVDDSFERSSVRRSGRRKRVEHLNGETQSRERGGSPPSPAVLTSADEPDGDTNSKQSLKAKINEWMLHNEREQRRERDLQMKLQQERKRWQANGQTIPNGDTTNLEKGILEGIEEIDAKQLLSKELGDGNILANSHNVNGGLKITKSAQLRQNDSFTQKIIGLINATSNESTPFLKTRLYHSTRENKSTKEKLEEKSKDDSNIQNEKQKLSLVIPSESRSSTSNSDQESKETTPSPKILESNFDRFSATRKTKRRLKLREMRIEAENAIKTVKPEEKNSNSDQESISTLSPNISNKSEDPSRPCGSSQSPPIDDSSFNSFTAKSEKMCHNETPEDSPPKCIVPIENVPNDISHNDSVQNKEVPAFNRQRNTSLRSRQSRLARRINSLSTPVTSPEITENNITVSEADNKRTDAVSEKELNSSKIKSFSDKDTTVKETLSNKPKSEGNPPSFQESGKVLGNEKEQTNTNKSDEKLPKLPNLRNKIRDTPKINGHISHKVTVSTETKSKVCLPKSNSNQILKNSKSRTPSEKTTSIPSVIKTTQNVKVHQTIHRQPQMNGTKKPEMNAKHNSPTQSKTSTPKSSSPSQSPSLRKKVPPTNKELKSSNLTNGKPATLKNGKASPSSSISSLCSLSTNVKMINNLNGRTSHSPNAKKITINQNGSVRFSKNVNSSNKVAQKNGTDSNSTSKIEKKNVTTKAKAFI